MSLSFESATKTRLSPQPIRPVPAPAIAPRPSASLFRVVWRWHFYAGVIVAPILMVAAATGALYIFRDELQRIMYARLLSVAPAETRVSYDEQLAAVAAELPPGFRITQWVVEKDPSLSTIAYVSDGKEFRSVYVDPYRGNVLGSLGSTNFFAVVLKIHRTLFAGTAGRIVMELMTCWTIVLLITGLYLWWPRKRGQVWGAWLPRLKRQPYILLRDLHAVCGVYAWAIALTIATTGLIYTFVWGQGYGYVARETGAYDIFTNPPKSNSSAETPRMPMDRVVAVAAQQMPDTTLSVRVPQTADGAYVVFAIHEIGPTTGATTVIDHATGEVLMHRTNSQFPALSWWATWNYPLHVGSILGLPTKILWLLACIVLMLMPITGVWMWWQRRPKGRSGFPRKPETKVPRWLAGVIAALCFVLPALGASVLLIILGERATWLVRGKFVGQAPRA
jgi:uncharacterized iron-regulated membrane protein